jgi:hypothetical protein
MTLLFTSCKYDDGPVISFRSKKVRVANQWKISSFKEAGKTVNDTIGKFFFEFTKDGILLNKNEEEIGTWEFKSGKEDIRLSYPGESAGKDYKINKLKEDELSLTLQKGVTLFVDGEISRTIINVDIVLNPY